MSGGFAVGPLQIRRIDVCPESSWPKGQRAREITEIAASAILFSSPLSGHLNLYGNGIVI